MKALTILLALSGGVALLAKANVGLLYPIVGVVVCAMLCYAVFVAALLGVERRFRHTPAQLRAKTHRNDGSTPRRI